VDPILLLIIIETESIASESIFIFITYFHCRTLLSLLISRSDFTPDSRLICTGADVFVFYAFELVCLLCICVFSIGLLVAVRR